MAQSKPWNWNALVVPAACSALAVGLIAGTYGKKSALDQAVDKATATWNDVPVVGPSATNSYGRVTNATKSVERARSIANTAAAEPVRVVEDYESAANLVNRGSILTTSANQPRVDGRVVKTQLTQNDSVPDSVVKANAAQGGFAPAAPVMSAPTGPIMAKPMAPPTVIDTVQGGGVYNGGFCSTCEAPAGSCSCAGGAVASHRGRLFTHNRKLTAQECFPPQGMGCDRCPCPCPSEEVLSYYRCNFYGHFPTLWRPWPNDWMKYRPIVPNTMYDRYRLPPKGTTPVDSKADEPSSDDDDLKKLQERNIRPRTPNRTRPTPEGLDDAGPTKTSFLGQPVERNPEARNFNRSMSAN